MPTPPDTAVCLHCGYSLRGLPENRCPECGGACDPADASTWRDLSRATLLQRVARYLRGSWPLVAEAPRIWELVVIGFFAVCVAEAYTAPAAMNAPMCDSRLCDDPVLLLLLVVLLHLAIAVLTVPIRMFVGREPEQTSDRAAKPRRDAWRWVALVLLGAALWTLYFNARELYETRLQLSRSAFANEANCVRSAGTPDNHSHWVGLIHVDRVGPLTDGRVKFEIHVWYGTLAYVHDPARIETSPCAPGLGPDWHVTSW